MDFIPYLILTGIIGFIVYQKYIKRNKSDKDNAKPGNNDYINRPK